MSNGFTDKLKGAANKIKGEVKEEIGKNTNDPSLQVDGQRDQLKGEAQERAAEVKDKITSKIDEYRK
ncbi:CsbD family protein [Solibacillus sp. FSL W7-1464]|uniref:CsbD family protein n=1 Tax=Solibacillus sp. FSL W7-1464 TaxID=2921706 RepID=UPI0030F7CC47